MTHKNPRIYVDSEKKNLLIEGVVSPFNQSRN